MHWSAPVLSEPEDLIVYILFSTDLTKNKSSIYHILAVGEKKTYQRLQLGMCRLCSIVFDDCSFNETPPN